MKSNEQIVKDMPATDIKPELEKPEWNPRTRSWETPPKESDVTHSPNAF